MEKTLTFGKLAVGDKFIGLPIPGDDKGHGGLKGVHLIFIKTEEAEAAFDLKVNSVQVSTGILSHMPDNMSVIHVR
ncbi:hypothetical protein HY967_01780 [Candidatus Jorgensenbacteria bacterium]|nr:hypothetical protein [Candidatus Jorgensenbacteria bacterium]